MLGQRRVEARLDARLADMGGQADRRGDLVHRHVPRLVVRAAESLIHADRENRQIVEKERVEMIGVEHHDDVGAGGGKLLFLRREQLGGFAIGAVALDEEREDRSVRHAETGDDAGHVTNSSPDIRFTLRLRHIRA